MKHLPNVNKPYIDEIKHVLVKNRWYIYKMTFCEQQQYPFPEHSVFAYQIDHWLGSRRSWFEVVQNLTEFMSCLKTAYITVQINRNKSGVVFSRLPQDINFHKFITAKTLVFRFCSCLVHRYCISFSIVLRGVSKSRFPSIYFARATNTCGSSNWTLAHCRNPRER